MISIARMVFPLHVALLISRPMLINAVQICRAVDIMLSMLR